MIEFDVVIVGAGFAGLVMAERLASQTDLSVLIIEQRRHVGGNAFDYVDDHGVLVHKYGPHYFRTNSRKILDYLGRFTAWRIADYRIKSYIDGSLWPFPINLNTFEKLIGRPSNSAEMEETLKQWRVVVEHPQNSEELIVSQVGWKLYRMFFEQYTRKQWNRHPRDLDPSVCGRIPIRTNRDDRYLRERHQVMPAEGYHYLFSQMLQGHRKIKVLLGVDFRRIRAQLRYRWLIYTGRIDEYFGFRLGRLPYRSLRFEHESFGPDELAGMVRYSRKPGFWQPVVQVNYPSSEPYTRVVEIKHVTGQQCENTTIVREYPQSAGDPYYPVPAPDSRRLYDKYRDLAQLETHTSFIGRLATYRYYNMDQVVGMALAEFRRLMASDAFGLKSGHSSRSAPEISG